MANIANVINTILQDVNSMCSTRIPTVTATNIEEVGSQVLSSPVTQNAFLNCLVNKVAMTLVRNKTFKNPLSVLKKGGVPTGKGIEDIMANPAKASSYDENGSTLLNRSNPDIKAVYYKMNRQDKYKVTINKSQLISAFRSMYAFEQLLNLIVSTLYSGDNIDEFLLMKKLFASGIEGNKIKTITVNEVTNTESARELVKGIKKVSKAMALPTTAFNMYSTVNTGSTPVTTWTPIQDQILILRNDISVDIDVEMFAQAFNVEYATFKTQSLEIDAFGDNLNCYAILCDKSFVQVYDDLEEIVHFRNDEGLYDNYIWHHWQTYGLSYFANAVAFCKEATQAPQG